MPESQNEQPINNALNEQEATSDPVDRLKQENTEGWLAQKRAELKQVAAAVALSAVTGGAGAALSGGKIKNIRQLIRFIKGITAFTGSIGDVFISVPTFLLVGLTDLVLSYILPGWEIDKFEKYFTILFLFIFSIIIIFVVAFFIGAIKEACIVKVITDVDICSVFL